MSTTSEPALKYGETVKTWTATLDGHEYLFRMQRQFWTGERSYYVNDERIAHTKPGLGNSASFTDDVTHRVGSHDIRFRYRAAGRIAFYELFIDNEKIEGKETSALRFPPMVAVILLMLLLGIAALSMLAN